MYNCIVNHEESWQCGKLSMWVDALGGPLDIGVVLQGGQCPLGQLAWEQLTKGVILDGGQCLWETVSIGVIGLGATDQRSHFPWGVSVCGRLCPWASALMRSATDPRGHSQWRDFGQGRSLSDLVRAFVKFKTFQKIQNKTG